MSRALAGRRTGAPRAPARPPPRRAPRGAAPRVPTSLQRRGDRLVLAHRRMCEVPGPLVAGRDPRERVMRGASRRTGRAVVDRRAQQRMAKLEALAARSTARPPAPPGRGRLDRGPSAPSASITGCTRSAAARGGDQQPAARCGGQAREPVKQGAHQRRADGQRLVDRLLAGELRVAEEPRQLEQRERIAFAALGQQRGDVAGSAPCAAASRAWRRPRRARGASGAAGHALSVVEDAPRPRCDQHGDALAAQASCGEQQRVGRGRRQATGRHRR